ncbi:hypothetical protein N1851_005184 [Merluccius polli]|uniref:Uncharacterized protein n=1 Tax=Merluccius polli TaxID=89951 RepID=A0AA47N7T8_MERPO|nr:hypothetical protein N1851_005184 [Merluccius polli]
MESEELGVLIGGDQYWKIVTGKMEKLEDGLVALESVFEWLVQGEVTTLNIVTEAVDIELLHVCIEQDQALSNQLRSFWELESLGIGKEELHSETDETVLKRFEETVKFADGIYEVRLPWKNEHVTTSSNYVAAKN